MKKDALGLTWQKGDFLAVGMVLLTAFLLPFFFDLWGDELVGDPLLEVYHQGKLVGSIPLIMGHEQVFEVKGEYVNTIAVAGRTVRFSYSDCPGQDCVHSGKIDDMGRSLICLPNQVELRIVGKGNKLDGVVG